MPISPPTLFFPVEIINREFDSKLLLATLAAQKGYRVYLGNHSLIYKLCLEFRNGIYLGKNIFNKVAPLHARGFRIVYLGEEAAIYQGGEAEWKRELDSRFNPSMLAPEDLYCCWGKFQQQHFQSTSTSASPEILVTGHPRFDLVKAPWKTFYQKDIEAIRNTFGRYLLLNTNFKYSNFQDGAKVYFSDERTNGGDPAIRRFRYRTFAANEIKRASFIRLINELSEAFPDHHIILRPHPSENLSSYHDLLKPIPRAKAIYDNAVNPWILGADALIQNGCTTGVEAVAAGTPTITFAPFVDSQADFPVPNQLGTRCVSDEEVITTIRSFLQDPQRFVPDPAAFRQASDLIENLPQTSSSSFERLLAAIQVAARQMPVPEGEVTESSLRAQDRAKAFKAFRRLWRSKLIPFYPAAPSASHYHTTKFPGFTTEWLQDRLERVHQLGLHPSVRKINSELLVFEAESPA